MKKSASIISASLLTAFLAIPAARGRADDDDRRQQQDLREDRQQLQQLRERRDHENREGDRHEAREYNDKIDDLQRDIHRDRQTLRDHDHDRRHHDDDRDHD